MSDDHIELTKSQKREDKIDKVIDSWDVDKDKTISRNELRTAAKAQIQLENERKFLQKVVIATGVAMLILLALMIASVVLGVEITKSVKPRQEEVPVSSLVNNTATVPVTFVSAGGQPVEVVASRETFVAGVEASPEGLADFQFIRFEHTDGTVRMYKVSGWFLKPNVSLDVHTFQGDILRWNSTNFMITNATSGQTTVLEDLTQPGFELTRTTRDIRGFEKRLRRSRSRSRYSSRSRRSRYSNTYSGSSYYSSSYYSSGRRYSRTTPGPGGKVAGIVTGSIFGFFALLTIVYVVVRIWCCR